MEADFVTGPAKNLLEFAQRSAWPEDNLPTVNLSIVAYLRGDQEETAFIRASREACIPLDIVTRAADLMNPSDDSSVVLWNARS